MTYRLYHDRKFIVFLILLVSLTFESLAARSTTGLEGPWKTAAAKEDIWEAGACADPEFDDASWKSVKVPHNWDSYEGFRQLKHGNFHGTAWYRTTFKSPEAKDTDRIFLYFEGVGSYATVYVNGMEVGRHAGGLTTFTLDVTDAVEPESDNLLAVKAEHPSGIRDLPWVCGGCEQAYGFSEGSQPFGIFRPVHIVVTDSLRIAPFGVHAWNGQEVSGEEAVLHLRTEVTNHGNKTRSFRLRTILRDASGEKQETWEAGEAVIPPGESTVIAQENRVVHHPVLWSPDNPHLYTIESVLLEAGKVIDRTQTPYGIRSIEWPDLDGEPGQPLLVNGKPFFINGVADYEHLLGGSHAFSAEQVQARAGQILAAGFNAFRDAHHPHNLRFNEIWDRNGILWWTQFGAHIWFENEDFKDNYKQRLRDWVRERRNSPSLFLYGLQNESKLPAGFARECMEIIRELDPTASSQRPVVTCNGGTGTDWDVPQNWSGTYGGDLFAYSEELIEQRMVGEYGAWRSIGFHSEGGFIEDGPLTEDRMTALMETKLRLAEKVRDKVIGHFAWPFTTHANPGRNTGSEGQQILDGIREWDRIGPANNKGLLTLWGEPLDVFYMYRSHYAPPDTDPMVYIVSHTWPDRWTEPGLKNGILVYSNAEEVELFNGFRERSLGIRQRGEKGTHFRWDNVPVETNVLYAEARIDGKTVATDIIQLNHLPADPSLADWDPQPANLTRPQEGLHYLYRVNAGGAAFTDSNGNRWRADQEYRGKAAWGWQSWASRFENLPPAFGSKREIRDPVKGTVDDPLFQSFRYGREELKYIFKVPDGHYRVELYFIEPWYGTGGIRDAAGWRLFDVAVNGVTVIDNLDLWQEAGRAQALKRTFRTEALDGHIEISFPEVLANQAVISAIAIAAETEVGGVPQKAEGLITPEPVEGIRPVVRTHLDTGLRPYIDRPDTFSFIAWELRESAWIQAPKFVNPSREEALLDIHLNRDSEVFVAMHPDIEKKPAWLKDWERSPLSLVTTDRPGVPHDIYRRRFSSGSRLKLGAPSGEGRPDAPMYTVIVKEYFPPPGAESVHDFSVSQSRNPEAWHAFGNLRSGRLLYGDGAPVISHFSSRLSDCDWIQASREDATNPEFSISFRVEDHTEVFVGLDSANPALPSWMSGWIATGWQVTSSPPDSTTYLLYKKRFRPGERVVLGPNVRGSTNADPGAMYTVVIRTVRPDRIYSLNRTETNLAEWTITVGVGDRYGLNFRYKSPEPEPVQATLEIISRRDGAVVCSDTILLPPTSGTEWEYSRHRTCDDINAGTYYIRLEGDGLGRLEFDRLQVE